MCSTDTLTIYRALIDELESDFAMEFDERRVMLTNDASGNTLVIPRDGISRKQMDDLYTNICTIVALENANAPGQIYAQTK